MRGIRSLLANLVGLLGHRLLLFPGALGAWWLYATQYSWQPGQQHMMYVLIGGWAFFNLVSARQLARLIRPKLRLDKIEMPKPPAHMAPAAPAPVAAQRQPPVASFLPGGPQPPRPTRVMLLVDPPSPAASSDEASIVARLNPSLRQLMQRPADTPR